MGAKKEPRKTIKYVCRRLVDNKEKRFVIMEGDKACYNGLLRYHLNINKTLQGMARFSLPRLLGYPFQKRRKHMWLLSAFIIWAKDKVGAKRSIALFVAMAPGKVDMLISIS